MKLNYRGTSYDYNPPTVNTNETEVGGKFRGMDWRFRKSAKANVIQPTTHLTYRGVKYQIGEETSASDQVPTSLTEDKARTLMLNKERTRRNLQQNMLGRSAHEVGLEFS